MRKLCRAWSAAAAIETNQLDPAERLRLDAVGMATASDAVMHNAIADLTNWVHRSSGRQVVVLIDEYDTPIIAGWTHGYYNEVIAFFRTLFSAGLKDNPHLYRGVLTGILRIAKESLFSGLNNLTVYSVLSRGCADRFGFTPGEVAELARRCDLEAALPDIEAWYNGYTLAGRSFTIRGVF